MILSFVNQKRSRAKKAANVEAIRAKKAANVEAKDRRAAIQNLVVLYGRQDNHPHGFKSFDKVTYNPFGSTASATGMVVYCRRTKLFILPDDVTTSALQAAIRNGTAREIIVSKRNDNVEPVDVP